MSELSRKKLQEYYSSQGEDRERMYLSDPFREFFQKKRLKKIKELVDINYDHFKEPVIVDIGCGDGFSTSFIINNISYKYLMGLDLSMAKLSKAKKKVGSFCGFVGSAENLPFAGNSFDYVFCLETLEHLLDPLKAMKEIKRVLKPAGLCFISIPLDSSWQEKIVNINKAFKKAFIIDDDFKEHIQFFPMKRVVSLLKASGMEIISFGRSGFKFPFRKAAFRILGNKKINRLDDWLSVKIPIGVFGYRALSIGNEFLIFVCKQSKKIF